MTSLIQHKMQCMLSLSEIREALRYPPSRIFDGFRFFCRITQRLNDNAVDIQQHSLQS